MTTQRKYAKRKTRQIYRHLDTVMANLLELSEIFEDDHESQAAALSQIAQVTLVVQDLVEKWYEMVWGSVPADWYGDAP